MRKISVVIPAYGNAELVPNCLESLLRQDFASWEAVVVNDASPDEMSEVLRSYADKDERFVVVEKTVNEGRHLARKTGTEHANGEFVMYLDADDELVDETVLGKLNAAVESASDADVIRFGLAVETENGTPDSAAEGFVAWSNYPCGSLLKDKISFAAFHDRGGFAVPWHVTHRLFKMDLAKRAFASMTGERLERAEDAYEFLVIASLAQHEVERCDIMGYLYHMGFGVTNVTALSADRFMRESAAIKDCYEIAAAYADSFGDFDLHGVALGFKHKLLESMGNDLNSRVATEEREEAERRFTELVGPAEAACEYYRFLRDLAYDHLVNDVLPAPDDEVFRLEKLAAETFAQATDAAEIERCKTFKEPADSHVRDLRKRIRNSKGVRKALRGLVMPVYNKIRHRTDFGERNASMSEPSTTDFADDSVGQSAVSDCTIRIFAATHRRTAAFESSIIEQIQVGSGNAKERFENTLHDDEGDNITELNPLYCELTAQYWAWKNVDADYYGFCHYRRYFDFSDVEHEENSWGEVMEKVIDKRTQAEYGLGDAAIRRAIEGYDVVTTRNQDLQAIYGGFSTPLEHWSAAPDLHDQDLIDTMAILELRHPDYAPDVEAYLRGNRSRFCNMFIMRKAVFDEYCAWLFPLLDDFMQVWDKSRCNREALRTPGHLSERLLNIFLMHKERTGANLKVKEVQCVHFEKTDAFIPPCEITADQAGGRPIVPVVLAADDNYAPMLATTAYSMLKNASADRFYHVVVLTTDISPRNQEIMRGFLEPAAPCAVDFVSVERLIDGYDLTTSNRHISIETYYRFLIQDVLPFYDKVLYLDSDLIIEGDVAELFDTDVEGNCLAAVIDVDYLGNLNMGPDRMAYTRDVLGLKDPYSYFQAGVLVMNTAELRKTASVAKWLEIAQNPAFIYNDQDILNVYCEGRVVYLDPAWNVMIDGCNRIQAACSHAPADVFNAYLGARTRERIIHYAGADKPWTVRKCDRGERYWAYVRETPYYEQLLMMGSFLSMTTELRKSTVRMAKDKMWPIIDVIVPPRSRRRDLLRPVVDRIRR